MKKLLFALLFTLLAVSVALAGNVPYFPPNTPLDPSNAIYNLNTLIQVLNQNLGTTAGVNIPKNVLDNPAFYVDQRAATATCGTTSGMPETAYGPDRWACDVNEASGAGQLAQVTATPSPLLGQQYSATLVRNSGSLTNPVCVMEEVPASKVSALQGQTIDFSVYLQALAGLAADNGNQASVYLFTGTTADQGLGTMTTSVKAASVTAATTGIITYTNTLTAGQPVYFTAATIPTGFIANQVYYVSSTNLTTSQFSVATTYAAAVAGTVLAPSSAGTTVVVYVPYITPAWAGLQVLGQSSPTFQNAPVLTLSASNWQRYSTGLLAVPNNALELAAAVCFTPTTAVSGGSTDGIALAAAQVEALGLNAVGPTGFELKDYNYDLLQDLAYYWQINEPAASKAVGNGNYQTATICDIQIPLPVPMRKIPTLTIGGTAESATTWAIMVASTTPVVLASTWLIQDAVIGNTPNMIAVQGTTASKTAGYGCTLVGAGGGANIQVGADF